MIVGKKIVVVGKVQGVFFRKYTAEKALSLGLTGFVRNQRDGSVYIEVEGGENALLEFEKWCHEGSPYANVERVEVSELEPQNFVKFEIRRL